MNSCNIKKKILDVFWKMTEVSEKNVIVHA